MTELATNMSVKLNTGYQMPIIGLGTWQSKPGEVATAVEAALKNGYRHIDCAWAYGNQKEIGEVFTRLFSGEIKREDVFITSKVWNTYHSFEKAKENIDMILSELQLSYIDLLLIHWPMGYKEGGEPFPKDSEGKRMLYSDVDYLDTWKALEEAQKDGKVRSIGISNFNHKQISRLLEKGHVKPAVLQVEIHPYLQQKKLRWFCKEKGITVVAYSSLGNPGSAMFRQEGDPNILEEKAVKEIAQRHGKTTAQVALRWAVQNNILVIPKSTKEERIRQNADLFNFELSQDEMSLIEGLDRNWRIVDLTASSGDHPHFPFAEEY